MAVARLALRWLCLPSLLAGPTALAADPPTPPGWMVNGFIAALDDTTPGLFVAANELAQTNGLWEAAREQKAELAPKIAARLADPDSDVRLAAMAALGALGATEQTGAIAAFLTDPEGSARSTAVQALGAMGAKEQGGAITALLADPEIYVARAAVQALGVLGASNQAEAIAGLLASQKGSTRVMAVQALAAVGAKEQAGAITALLADPDREVGEAAVRALALLIAKDQAEAIAGLLASQKGSTRVMAVQALAAVGAKEQAGAITALLADPESYLRGAAVQALGALEAKDQGRAIAALLTAADLNVRSTALEALGASGAKNQSGAIAALLTDPEVSMRVDAVRALSALDAKGQAGAVAVLLTDRHVYVRLAAAQALGKFGAKDQAGAIAALLAETDDNVRLAAVQALGALGAKEQAGAIAALLTDPDFEVQSAAREALRALGALGGTDQAGAIGARLVHPEGSVRAAAVQALGALGAQGQAEEIAALLTDPVDSVRAAAVEALGVLGVKNEAGAISALLIDPAGSVRAAAVEALGVLGAKDKASAIAALLADPDTWVGQAAVQALGALGAKDQAGAIAALLAERDWSDIIAVEVLRVLGALEAKDQAGAISARLADQDWQVRQAAAQVLGTLGEPIESVALIPLASTDQKPYQRSELRLAAHLVGAGRPQPEIWTAWLGRPHKRPIERVRMDGALARETLAAFQTAWGLTKSPSVLRDDLSTQVSTVVAQACPGPGVPVPAGDSPVERISPAGRQALDWVLGVLGAACWGINDRGLLAGLAADLREGDYTQVDTVDKAIAAIDRRAVWLNVAGLAGAHALFWIVLVAAYPRSPTVQAIFFWNPWVRRIGGLAYVGFLLAYVPFLRRRLFEPFRESLLAEADLAHLDAANYFTGSAVRTDSGEVASADAAIPEIRRQIVLEGDSGLGKSLFVRRLVGRSRRVAVYLPARRCEAGVLQAIQAKLHGPAQDADFLKQLVHLGAIDIAIDGLNEVSAETRATIAGFVEQFFKSNVLLATQPMEWDKPATARVYKLLPLEQVQIEDFLVSRDGELPATAIVSGAAYERAARAFLARTFDALATTPEREALQRALSNPMDLTLVAQVLGQGREPDLMALQEQAYRLMADDYATTNQGTPFPLKRFAEQVYAMRLTNEKEKEKELECGEFADEVAAMERHKMLLRRVDSGKVANSKIEWRFRHDKVMEFFIHHAFTATPMRISEHMDEPRFRGVYFLLAQRLPVGDARRLRERLIERAADTGDHTLSDEVVRILRGRLEAAPSLTPPAST